MEKTVKISLVGDIFPSNSLYTKGFGNGSLFLTGLDKSWEERLKKIFADSDITFGNMEVPLIEDNKIVNESECATSKSFASTLNKIGFNIVSIANNHILEHGESGFLSTQRALSDAGLLYVGDFNNYKSNIAIFEQAGMKFGFAAFNAIKDIPNPNLHADLTFENIIKTLDEMKTLNLDYKLVSLHWGNEYINIPSYDQIKLAESIIEYGANVIIGHHPHVIQPIIRYKDGIIIYSLGNFIFDFLYSKEFKLGMLVELYFNKNSKIDYDVLEVKLDEQKINSINKSLALFTKLNYYESKMHTLLNQSEYNYKHYYDRKLKLNRLYQRILMKFKLIEMLIVSKHRKRLLKNLFAKIRTYF